MEQINLVNNLDLYVVLKQSSKLGNYLALLQTVVSQFNLNLSEEDSDTLKEFCRRFSQAVIKRWKNAKGNSETFKNKYGDWLALKVDWPSCVIVPQAAEDAITENQAPSTSQSVSVGTLTRRLSPRKPFADLSTKQKKRRIEEHNQQESDELAYATVSMLKKHGKENLAEVIDYLMKNPEEAARFLQIIKTKEHKKCTFTPEKALGLLLSLKLSKWQYITLRESSIREGAADIYPSYYKVQQAKLVCYPPKEAFTFTDTMAKVSLQALLDITVQRILKSLPDKPPHQSLNLLSKWGFDGSSSQRRYKQKMEEGKTDEAIFMTTLVPLKLTAAVGKEEMIIWENPKPCSTLYCRPVQFIFVKESELVVKNEMTKTEAQRKTLSPSKCADGIEVEHNLFMTMIDGKVCTYLSEARSSAACYLCLAKPSQMNDLDAVLRKEVSSDMIKFGLSPLHAQINSMECLLHIAYKQDLKIWSVKGEDNKSVVQQRKKQIQDRFREELGLLIDIVKQGSGTTNDGNTARKFFEFPERTATITGLDEEIVRRFAVILQAITSGENIDVEKFRAYTRTTAERYLQFYHWYYMSATVHKLLIHGADIIKESIVPIGNLSEEASEARNKDFRRYREHHSRKINRTSTNEDIMKMMLLTSDPYISATRPVMNRVQHKTKMRQETLDLLIVEPKQQDDIEFCDIDDINYDTESDESDVDV